MILINLFVHVFCVIGDTYTLGGSESMGRSLCRILHVQSGDKTNRISTRNTIPN
jgi:hypothetical protein